MEFVLNYTYPEFAGRCHACVFNPEADGKAYTVYMRQSPVCIYEYEGQMYNIAEDIDRYTCFNDDPRMYDDIICKTLVSNDTFDCYNGCPDNSRI